MRQARNQATLLHGVPSSNRRPNGGDKSNTLRSTSSTHQEEHQGVGGVSTYRRVRLQLRSTLNNRQVPIRGRLRIQPVVPIGHSHLPLHERINLDASARVTHLKKVHEDTRHTIERQVQRLATKLNINKHPMVFNIGDLVWLHLRKDHFPQ